MVEVYGFVCVNTVHVEHIEIREFISRKSGLRVFLIRYESPVVNSYYILPTRGESHEGLPHTLEHLIFLGSAHYEHRGTLDILASKALSIGTNAWTDVDHTAYTISTAGLEGTLKIIPVYLDHILCPTLTEESFMTDVHRITPDGSNSGTVYCEMKTHENSADNLTHYEMVDHLYPGSSGYKMNTGGKLDALRMTSIERVREYHKKFYRLDNLSIGICGNVEDYECILEVISKAEASLIASGVEAHEVDVTTFFGTRHWDSPVDCQEMKESSSTAVIFPTDDEETGFFTIAWRGPTWNDYEMISAVSFMGCYLCDTSVAPLQKELVHNEDPFGSSINFSLEDFRESYFSITVQDVPYGEKGKLDIIESTIKRLLADIYQGDLNMDRLRTIIQRERLSHLLSLENSPHETAIDSVITYAIYSTNRCDLERLLKNDAVAESLMQKDEAYWKGILRYFIESPTVCVRTIPSIERSKEIELMEKELVQRQLEENDIEKLKAREAIVDFITSNKNRDVLTDAVKVFEAVSVSKLKLTEWPYIRNFTSIGADQDGGRSVFQRVQLFNENAGSKKVPCWSEISKQIEKIEFPMQVNHIASDFVRLTVMVPTGPKALTHFEKQSLPLLCALLFVSDIKTEDGKHISGDEFIRMLQNDTTSYGASLGIDSGLGNPDSYSELINVSITCHVRKYESMFKLFLKLLRNVKFTKKILAAHAKSMLKSLNKKKRSAKALILQASNAMRLRGDCVRMSCGLAQQLVFVKAALDGDVIGALQSLYKKLFVGSNLVVHVSCDLNKMPAGWLEGWAALSDGNPVTSTLTEHIGFKFGVDTKLNDVRGLYTSIASTDVTYFRFVIAAPIGFRHKEYTALCVLSEYLSMMEGPMFRAIRGGGFAYNYNVPYFPSRGELHLSIQQATDVIGAIRATQELFQKIINGEVLNEEDIFAARCSLVFGILDEEETLADYSHDTFNAALRNVSSRFSRECLDEIQSIGVEEIREVAIKYLAEFMTYKGEFKTLSLVTSRSQARDIYEGLQDLNYSGLYQTNVKSLLAFASNGVINGSANSD
ncbi:presequence protease [Babesia gibsoni]|uniref:Presequence protease n=1 Tax=Babesia gibsoni TaxID=33632 RepID=A0AAD8PE50_BABGI|nr:presequence protease [Babesia gibsoni]